MPTTITIDPVTRLEGHLKMEVDVNGSNQVTEARSSGTMFRGFERILIGRDPRDATHLTQRICGVCPVSHGMASALCLEDAFGVVPADNGRIMRNLVLGANFIQSHILHFYHLAALDFVKGPEMPPWTPRYDDGKSHEDPTAFYRFDPDTTAVLVGHYVEALQMRMKAHEMGAIFGGKLPCVPNFVPGGITEAPTAEDVDLFRSYLAELQAFIENVYVPDVLAVAGAYPEYFGIGVGCGNLLAYGVFDLDVPGEKLLPRGRYDGAFDAMDPAAITEYVKYSWYTPDSGGVNPAEGVTEPDMDKPDGYTWLKSPRYDGTVYELGPLARMFVAYLDGVPRVVELVDGVLGLFGADASALFSILGRHAARALECQFVAEAMDGWLDQIVPGGDVYTGSEIPETSAGMGLTEAPRGALGHWIDIADAKIARYQVITPTNWNASPKDDFDQPGPIEQALEGLIISDADQPLEVLRVIHSFDPCLACSVHLITPGNDVKHFMLGA